MSLPVDGNNIVVEGHAIVSEDGMIADAAREMAGLRNETDWRLFQAALDRAVLVALGRRGHERHPNSGRRRLVLTRRVADLATDPRDPLAVFWNPAGMAIGAVLDRLQISRGVLAVTGAFDVFLPCYDRFLLSEVRGLRLPDGIPCFTGGPPQQVLQNAGLIPQETTALDVEAGVSQTRWTRASN